MRQCFPLSFSLSPSRGKHILGERKVALWTGIEGRFEYILLSKYSDTDINWQLLTHTAYVVLYHYHVFLAGVF